MTCYRGFLLGGCRRVAGGRAALRAPGAGAGAGGRRRLGQGPAGELAGCGRRPDGGFRPSRVVVVAKTTRYEFEQQRYRYAELSEEDLKHLVGPAGGPAPPRRPGAEPAPLAPPLALGSLVGSPLSPVGGGSRFVQRPHARDGSGSLRWGRGAPQGGFQGFICTAHRTPSWEQQPRGLAGA